MKAQRIIMYIHIKQCHASITVSLMSNIGDQLLSHWEGINKTRKENPIFRITEILWLEVSTVLTELTKLKTLCYVYIRISL